MNKKINEIAGKFKIEGEVKTAQPYGSGLINETILLTCGSADSETRYILRKINGNVFKRPEIVVKNTRMVLEHVKRRMRDAGMNRRAERTVSLLQTGEGEYSFKDEEGEVWCLMPFCEETFYIDVAVTEEQAFQTAKAFGEFQKFVIDAELDKYEPTIPDFHNTMKRFEYLLDVIEKNPAGRNSSAEKEIEFALENQHLPSRIKKLLEDKTIPLRLTHNDTKINNVLFDKKTSQTVCVIDLDTVMPGTVLYDFGDMVRTSTCAAAEDENDLSKVSMDIKIFEALARGYLEELNGVITEREIENLVYGGELIIYEQAIRFLADYLDGDSYYKIKYPEHNLDRAKNQFALLGSVREQKSEMEKIVNEILKNGEK